MNVAQETAAVVSVLPEDKARSVLEFAKFLAEQEDDKAWNETLGKAQYSSKFRARVAEVEREIAQGNAEPMDLDRL